MVWIVKVVKSLLLILCLTLFITAPLPVNAQAIVRSYLGLPEKV
ncbi:MAG: hypothetical protein AAFR77_07305 [Cyanobacteria bacterium J06631_2]